MNRPSSRTQINSSSQCQNKVLASKNTAKTGKYTVSRYCYITHQLKGTIPIVIWHLQDVHFDKLNDRLLMTVTEYD